MCQPPMLSATTTPRLAARRCPFRSTTEAVTSTFCGCLQTYRAIRAGFEKSHTPRIRCGESENHFVLAFLVHHTAELSCTYKCDALRLGPGNKPSMTDC